MHEDWKQNLKAETDQWDRIFAERTYCHVTQYSGSDSYCWQTARGDFRLAGVIRGRDAAMRQAEETMALPIDEFNRRVTAELIDDLRKIERDIMRLSPATDLLPGYHAGYEAGAADVKRRIAAAIELGGEGHNTQ
ncbi:MAG: hypothetical protein ROZ09_15035 [Thiobacillus sp.]|uniref:hypothetical protein n=1 Tax=Thiobacillus sp. TaxID=924 RepID=UPI002893EE95|nr:hypothetical protein [Thiobacillus sp.]MDT3708135.1 hypothetical protein [Thiobacillus sp.]